MPGHKTRTHKPHVPRIAKWHKVRQGARVSSLAYIRKLGGTRSAPRGIRLPRRPRRR